MYFPVGWPKSVVLSPPNQPAHINHICCDAVKILVAAIGDDFLSIFYANPLVPIVFHERTVESTVTYGKNKLIVWKPDSRQIVILTTLGVLILYRIDFETAGGRQAGDNGILIQIDPPVGNMKRVSAELFIKEDVPRLRLHLVRTIQMPTPVSTVYCISMNELLVATNQCEIWRMQWSDLEEKLCQQGMPTGDVLVIDVRSLQFYMNHNCHLNSLPAIGERAYIAALEYSPFIGGCAVVFSDNRAAFLVTMQMRFDMDSMLGFWLPDVEDATVCSVNHKFRLLAYGRRNGDVCVYGLEESPTTGCSGGLEFSHRLSLNASVSSANGLGEVRELKWSPDGCVVVVAWSNGGLALWSTFGTLLMSTFNWDFGVHVEVLKRHPLNVCRMEWCTEGYQLLMTCTPSEQRTDSNIMQMNFVKSTLSTNPCMASQPYILLQGEDTLYLNQADSLEKIYYGKHIFPNNNNNNNNNNGTSSNANNNNSDEGSQRGANGASNTLLSGCAGVGGDSDSSSQDAVAKDAAKKDIGEGFSDTSDTMELNKSLNMASILSASKYWSIIQLPHTYAATNWPIRYTAIDAAGHHLAIAGRTGMAHYSLLTRKWKLFGNESQEKDFVVSGGLLWWHSFIVMGCYSLIDRTDELRCYPAHCKLDNQYGNKIQVRAPVISLNSFEDQLITLTNDGVVSLYALQLQDGGNTNNHTEHSLSVVCVYEVDVKSICIHPACIVSLSITNLRCDTAKTRSSTGETIILNVCGRILMIQRDCEDDFGGQAQNSAGGNGKNNNNSNNGTDSLLASCLASCVECFWLSHSVAKRPMRDCLWLYSGCHGMRVWLPILPPPSGRTPDAPRRLHSFMSKRIMLSFPLKLYPLAVLFDNVVVLGVENDTLRYSSESRSHFSLPFCVLERKSQVYLHKILRQLIKRNLGYSAWEMAKSCRTLPYFAHSLELLLHEVLEEEATSKEPIPDALLPSILDFIREFPVYLQTIVQCARKTEIALWPYLFSMAGKPKHLFQQCLQADQLETAASYLIILQNLEPSLVSKQYAIHLLDIALENRRWHLAKDLIRFLKAIDPREIDSPRSSMVVKVKIVSGGAAQATPPVEPHNPEVFNLILGSSMGRERGYQASTAAAAATTMGLSATAKAKEKPANVGDGSGATVTTATAVVASALSAAGSSDHTGQLPIVAVSGAVGGQGAAIRRKSEQSKFAAQPHKEKEKFCIDAILQQHASKLLLGGRLLELGKMSAHLDFHMVAWLSQQQLHDAAVTRVADFVRTLLELHEVLQLSAPIMPTAPTSALLSSSSSCKAGSGSQSLASDKSVHVAGASIDYAQLLQQLPPTPAIPHATSSQTSESGYFSLPLCELPPSLSAIGHADVAHVGPCTSYVNGAQSLPLASLCLDGLGGFGGLHGFGEHTPRILTDKLAIKIRYLLQLFTEANCSDYALLLSVLLQDAASIGRIINAITRSESVSQCARIAGALKHLTQWAFEQECIYRPFMITLQPYVYRLEQFVQSRASAAVSDSATLQRKTSNGMAGGSAATETNNSAAVSANANIGVKPQEIKQLAKALKQTNITATTMGNIDNGKATMTPFSSTKKSSVWVGGHSAGGSHAPQSTSKGRGVGKTSEVANCGIM